MIGLDFDNGIPFHIIQQKAEHYHLKILFAYRTFSDTAEHEKFRVVFALWHKITDSFTARSVVNIFMKIFENCDEACKDSARLFLAAKVCDILQMSRTKFHRERSSSPSLHIWLTNMTTSTKPESCKSSTPPIIFALKRITPLQQIKAALFQNQVLRLPVLMPLTSPKTAEDK